MPLHRDRDVSFETPADWEDRTVVAFRAPTPAATARDPARAVPIIALTREPILDVDTLRMHADRRLLEVARGIPGFELLENREMEVGGRPAIQVRYAWTTDDGGAEQTVTFVERTLTPRSALVFAVTAPRDQANEARAHFDRVLASVAFCAARVPEPSAPPESVVVRRQAPEQPFPLVEIPMPGVRGSRRS